jgi:hypothetical protein
MPIPRSSLGLVVIAVAIAAAGCSDREPTTSGRDPLAGLAAATRGDTAPAPPDSTPRGAGNFVGTVYGYEPGRDTLETAVKIEGARVTAFVRAEANGDVVAGRQVATVLTNDQGFFRMPTLPAGAYVVTFVPPSTSPYRGGWTTAEAWQQSGDSPWYIMLSRK